ncbi:hypothetical protein, partial [Mycolicibacterium sp. XJ1819]
MSNISRDDRIDDVAPGDVVLVSRGSEDARPYKVVHKEASGGPATFVVTFEADNGETFQLDYPAGTRVTRALQAKWESSQSPTDNLP